MDGGIAITCPDPDCDGRFTLSAIEASLADDQRVLRRFWGLRAESKALKPLHCPYKDCSVLLEAHGVDDGAPAACGRCNRELCIGCKVPFHTGLSCDQFQALPAEIRSKEDIELLQLASAERWRRCPACGHCVERQPGGCNFLLCRCKHAFCYACGVSYKNTHFTANNVHGQPGCQCNLFQPPPEDRAFGMGAAFERMLRVRVAAPPGFVSLLEGRAELRNGQRWVKHTERGVETWQLAGPRVCEHSLTHAGCPFGVCCHLRHPDDDGPDELAERMRHR